MTKDTKKRDQKGTGWLFLLSPFATPVTTFVSLLLIVGVVLYLGSATKSLRYQLRAALSIGSYIPKGEYVAVMYANGPLYSGDHLCTFTIDQKERSKEESGYLYPVDAEDDYPFPECCIFFDDGVMQFGWNTTGKGYTNLIFDMEGIRRVGTINKTRDGTFEVVQDNGYVSVRFAKKSSKAGKALVKEYSA